MSSTTPSLTDRLRRSNAFISVLAIFASFVVGGILIAITDEKTASSASYFFARPLDTLAAAWDAAASSYAAMFRGAVFNYDAGTFAAMIKPLTETLTYATPLLTASLGVAVAFRAGLFNIGAQGQIILGAIFATWIGFTLDLAWPVHLLIVVIGSILGGALWGGIVGWIKARTGAHEVILTIMLNYVALNLVGYLLSTPALQRPGSTNPVSPRMHESAMYPELLGPDFRLHAGFLVALAATAFVWWLMNRSTLGFEIKAVGSNHHAARTAGINTFKVTVLAMVIAGAMAGLAGAAQVNGTERFLTESVAASIGFDAITVALLGRSNPIGVFFASLLFGAFRAGGGAMQIATGTPIDIVLVVQSLIVLFIAAPPLVRSMFGLGQRKRKKPKAPVAVAATTGGGEK
ncbi:ABC transporter permease [Zhihengliuella halotolerans]|uniref:Nucleoside ABC transporter membrane protein n=1 Tax=Zhihengliuella halotolerans TaxID=370736 RepID=A0A4Q8AD39_9MICC|nr:ABC transporter permease [Zhihengliuella halotolerans]RZU62132.1 nucleoside ABC transporter membrane protein [Zhihengliuella halotolerans]